MNRCLSLSLISFFIFSLLSGYTDFALALPPLKEVVVTGAAIERPKENFTTLIGSLSEELENVTVEHASELLNQVPGVWVHRGSGQEMLISVRSPVLTGAGACGAFWVGEQNIALRSAGFCNVNQLFEAHTEAAKAVTVFKGPHSVYHGSNSQYSSIQISLPLADEIEPGLSFVGSDLGFRHLQARHAVEHDGHRLGGIVTLKEDDAWRQDSGYKQQKGTFAHRWARNWTSVDTHLSLMNLEQKTAAFIEGDDAYRNKELRRMNLAPEAYRDATALRLQSRISTRSVDREFVWIPYLRSNRMEFLMHFLPWQPIEENGHDAVGLKFLRKRYWAGGLDTYWGFDVEYTDAFLMETQNGVAPFGVDRFPQGVHYDYSVGASHLAAQAGAYVPVPRTGVVADIGVRYDYDHYDYRTHIESGSACADGVIGCRFFRPEDRSDDFDNGSAHLGLQTQGLNNMPVFFLRWSRGFRLPQATELYRAQSDANIFPETERIKAWEFGARYEYNTLKASFALFHMRNRNGIFQDSQRLYVNGAHTDHRGFEYELSYHGIGERLQLNLSGTVAKHRYRNNPSRLGGSEMLNIDGNIVDTAPSDIHRLGVSWQQGAWQHELNVDDLGAYYLDPNNTEKYPGHTLLSWQSRWQMNSDWGLQVGVLNLTDRYAADRADIAFGTQRYFPTAPRTVYLGVSTNFN